MIFTIGVNNGRDLQSDKKLWNPTKKWLKSQNETSKGDA